jgi:hypothetical protein
VQDLLEKKYTINEIILHKMALETCTNNSTFKKTSPVLEYDRSAEHKVNLAILQECAEVLYNNYALTPRYTGILKEVYEELMSKRDVIRERLKKLNFEAEFFDRLTNNAGGMMQDHIVTKKQTNKYLIAMPDLPYGQRYLGALIDTEEMYNKEAALESVTGSVKAGKREQIDRRVRWIMMVINQIQAAFSIALSYGKELVRESSYIASGKQVGTMKDMLQVLRASSTDNTIITDNDIRGMDSSTQEQVADLVLNVVFQALSGLKIPNFLYARETVVLATCFDKHGSANGKVEVKLNAAQVYLIDIIGKMRVTNYTYVEGWVSKTTNIAGNMFWSGAFHTAVQHNTFLSSILSLLWKEISRMIVSCQPKMNGAVLGDDITLELQFSEMNLDTEKTATKIIKRLQSMLKDAGFLADPE